MVSHHQRLFTFAVAIWEQPTNRVRPVARSTAGRLRLKVLRQSMERRFCTNKLASGPSLRHRHKPVSNPLAATDKSHPAPKWVVDRHHPRALLDCTRGLQQELFSMGRSMVQTTSTVATLFLADMSSFELFRVDSSPSVCCFICFTSLPHGIKEVGEEASKGTGEARQDTALQTKL